MLEKRVFTPSFLILYLFVKNQQGENLGSSNLMVEGITPGV